MGKHGASVDNLISADVITADGDLRRANATENSDLFWALRGGSGNFGDDPLRTAALIGVALALEERRSLKGRAA